MSNSQTGKDQIYAKPIESITGFVFDEAVAEVFDDMIRRSVPGYTMTLSLMPLIARRFAQPNTRIYDLGCSLGAGMAAIANALPPSTSLIGVDSSPPMINRCEANLKRLNPTNPWELRCDDIMNTPIENASIALLNFTLQFIPLERRLQLLKTIFAGLKPGGTLLLSEKIRFDNPKSQANLSDLYHDYKKKNGYSDLEVSQKRNSLENVLIPETIEAHKKRLQEAGFDRSEVWLQCFNFVSILAVKE